MAGHGQVGQPPLDPVAVDPEQEASAIKISNLVAAAGWHGNQQPYREHREPEQHHGQSAELVMQERPAKHATNGEIQKFS